MTQYAIKVTPLTYQSGNITFSQWMSLFTICFAPLIIHIIAGAPEPAYLCRRRPRWHERMCLYSPVTILWRYAAITDRRIRAIDWSPSDLAAANAIFWTSDGWDGSEEMAAKSVQYCARLPDRTRMTLFSSESIKTIVVTLQGVNAIFSNVISTGDWTGSLAGYHANLSVGNVFSALALCGLLRLFATFWITNDFSYIAFDNIPPGMSCAWAVSSDSLEMVPTTREIDNVRHPGSKDPEHRFRPTSNWSRLFRFVFLSAFAMPCLGGLITILVFQGWNIQLTMTGAVGIALLAFSFALGSGVYAYYAARHDCKSTIIPCISATWYKVGTAAIYLGWAALVTVSAIETRRVPCGSYTTSTPESGDDAFLCPGLVRVRQNSTWEPFGLIAEAPVANTSTASGDGHYMVTYFTGSCHGILGENVTVGNSSRAA